MSSIIPESFRPLGMNCKMQYISYIYTMEQITSTKGSSLLDKQNSLVDSVQC